MVLPRQRQTGSICLIAIAILLLCQTCFGYNVKIIESKYKHNLRYGENFDISVTAENKGFGIGLVYFSPVLVHTETGIEKYPTASPVKRRFETGEKSTFSTQGWIMHDEFCPPPTGEYRVVFVLYGDNDKEVARVYGEDPIFINFNTNFKLAQNEEYKQTTN